MSWGAAHTGHALYIAAGGIVLGRVGPVLEGDTAVTADDDRGRNNVGCDCRMRHLPPGVVPRSEKEGARFVEYTYIYRICRRIRRGLPGCRHVPAMYTTAHA